MRTADVPYATFSPRAEQMYWSLRGVVLLAFVFQMLIGRVPSAWGISGWYLAAGYAVAIAGSFVAQRLTRISWDRLFWPSLAFDVLLITTATYLTGGIAGNFYHLYFLLTAFVGYHMGLTYGLTVATGITVSYAIPCIIYAGTLAIPDLLFRSAMFWMLAAATGLASRAASTSTARLLTAMNKLNERTTELERTHNQLQTIYETSRSLAELLAEENVIDRVLTIARSVLNYPVCEVYLYDRATQILWLKGRVDSVESVHFNEPRRVALNDVFRRVVTGRETVRAVDRHMGRTIIDGGANRSQLAVPMMTEGRVLGLLNAESSDVNAFGERDERVFSILAASTAMALVNADLHRKMEKLTIEDELTGLYNFRYLRARLEDEKRRAVRYNQPLSLIMVDIDWFKNLNDCFGHQIGNVSLRQIAEVIAGCIRDVDILARYGGEEFMVILPQTSSREAQTIGERIRREVEKREFGPEQNGRPIRLTVSIGISCFPENGVPEDDLVESVDRALYQAKGAGKNIVKISAPARA